MQLPSSQSKTNWMMTPLRMLMRLPASVRVSGDTLPGHHQALGGDWHALDQ